MTKKEFAMLAMILQEVYAKENFLQTNVSKDLWFEMLQDIPFPVAQASIKKWILTNKWSPTIAEIREIAGSLMLGDSPDWGEAWKEVQLAIRRYGSYRIGEAIESLSPLTRETVERIGFRNLCMSENETADRANFRMIYEQLAKRKQTDALMPVNLKQLISEIRVNNLIE